MHEMSIAQSVLDIVEEEMTRHGVEKLRAINLGVGKMSAVVPTHLNLCFQMLTEKTKLEGVILNIREIPVSYECGACSETFEVDKMIFECPACQEPEPALLTGRELSIENIEVED